MNTEDWLVDDNTPIEVLLEYANIQYKQAEQIIEEIDKIDETKIENLKKFRKRVCAERDFLKTLVSGEVVINKSHVTCSNLPHFSAILKVIHTEKDVIAVQKVFLYKHEEKQLRFEVDVVCRGGATWIKVKAMKPEAIQNIVQGNSTFGTKSITSMGEQMVECALQYNFHYKTPQCIVWFTKGVTEDVAEELSDMGIVIRGEIQNELNTSETIIRNNVLTEKEEPDIIITTVNLDVTTLIVLVSDVTNGYSHYNFQNRVLQAQAEEERSKSSLPAIYEFIKDKKLIICKMALEKFTTIVEIVGGPREKKRTKDLLSKVIIVEDCPSEASGKLKTGPKIKDQHIAIFGTGDFYKATTLTANNAFVRAAMEQGVQFSVFFSSRQSPN
jgi:hypothetical protein